MENKAQIKMFETIAILVVFFILLMFGFTFYTKVQETTSRRAAEEQTTLRAVDISEKVIFLPEIEYYEDNNPKGGIDILKLNAAAQIINENMQDYFSLFEYSYIYVEEIPLDGATPRKWLLYNFSREEDKGAVSTPFPTILYDPIEDRQAFGVLYVDVYR